MTWEIYGGLTSQNPCTLACLRSTFMRAFCIRLQHLFRLDLLQSASEWPRTPTPLIAMWWYRLSMSVGHGQKQWGWYKLRWWRWRSQVFSFWIKLSEPHPIIAVLTRGHKLFVTQPAWLRTGYTNRVQFSGLWMEKAASKDIILQ